MCPPSIRQWLWRAAAAAVLFLNALSAASAVGDRTLLPNVVEALNRFTGGHHYANEAARIRDQALLFANNDAINAARLNREISDAAYQAAQSDFNKLNTKFGQRAARSANAEFTVQTSTSQTFSPGTDSDYITIVKDKDQIRSMQADYNRRVNRFLTENGAVTAPRENWHNKLDTDFMGDPAHVSEAEFRDIAKMNNDAYKRRMAAEYERISRAKGGGKIGPEHVTAYTEEMSDFARKKKGKISEMFKNPSLFNDPVNRAKVIQMMAQEQKYISRIESLDDYLRAQEGLPKRNRVASIAKQGAVRDPHNVAAIRDAHKVAEASRAKAIEDLAETMAEVAHRNPRFSGSIADDLARIIAEAPAAHRARAIAKLTKSNPRLAEAVVARNPALTSADDVLRAGDDVGDIARASGDLGDVARAGRMRKGLTAAAAAMEKLGKVAATVDVAVAASQIKDYLDAINKALDPNTTNQEAADLLDKAAKIAEELAKSSALIAIMERHPAIAIIYGTWTLGCLAGEWVVASSEIGQLSARSKESCTDRQLNAWDNLVGTYGTDAERETQRRALCDKLKTAVREGRIKIKWPHDQEDACNAMKRGEKIVDLLENPDGPLSTAQLCANMQTRLGSVSRLVGKGELATAQGLLSAVRSKLTDAGSQACPGLDKQIDDQQGQIDSRAATQKAQAEAAISQCQSTAYAVIQNLPDGAAKTTLMARWQKALATDAEARDLLAEAQALASQSAPASALEKLQQARALEPCVNTVSSINEAIERISQTQMATAEAALDACRLRESRRLIDGLPRSARRQTLVDRWNKAYETEREARELIETAITLKDQGESKTAIEKLQSARNLKPCDSTVAAIDKMTRDIRSKMADEAEAALKACKFKDSRRLIAGLPEGPRRTALIESWDKTYENERKSRDRVREAMTFRNAGDYDRAISKLHEASYISSCDSTDAAIDKAIARIRDERDEGNRRCRAKYGSAAFAGRPQTDGQFECKCQTGFVWNTTKSACIRPLPTVADGHPVCRNEFGAGAYAAAVNPNRTFQCKCRGGFVMKNNRCRQVTIADGHGQCQSEFGTGAHAVAINPNGTFKCQCRDGYRWTAGNTRCIQLTLADGHAACQRQFGPRSRATSYRGNGSWDCYTPPPHAPPRCPPGYNPYGC